jgi:hypothetical protein
MIAGLGRYETHNSNTIGHLTKKADTVIGLALPIKVPIGALAGRSRELDMLSFEIPVGKVICGSFAELKLVDSRARFQHKF